MKAESLIIDRVLKFNNVYVFCSFLFFYFYPIIKFMNYNRQHELILNTGITLFLGALALKLELVKFFFSFLFFVLCGWLDGWVDGWVGGDFLPPSISLIF